MHLSDEAMAEFRAIWQEEHPGGNISDEALREMATRVLRAVEAVYLPISVEAARRPSSAADGSDVGGS